MKKVLEKAKEKSTVAGVLGFISSLGFGLSQGFIDPVSSLIAAIASLYLVAVDEKK
jgi:hypothetical protein